VGVQVSDALGHILLLLTLANRPATSVIPVGIFSYQNCQIWNILEGLRLKILVYVMTIWVFFMAIWYWVNGVTRLGEHYAIVHSGQIFGKLYKYPNFGLM
jgi:hypothetical protein